MKESYLDEIISDHHEKKISDRQLIGKVKTDLELQEEIKKRTAFLDCYDDVVIIERLYYVVNGLSEPVKCKFCDNKANWFDRGLKEGYRPTCKNKECQSKQLAERHTGSTKISENRDAAFIEWQSTVTVINDDIVKENIKYDKYIPLITNPIILDYLNNRFKDSDSLEETLARIEMGIEQKPICARPGCNNPVKWIGRKRALFTKHCCDACAAQNSDTREKCIQTNIEHWGMACVYDSSIYRQKVKEEYGVEYHAQRPDVIQKKEETWMEKYGVRYATQSDEVKEKTRRTFMEKYGVCTILLTPDVYEKSHNEETREKIEHTLLEKYGYTSPLSCPEIRKKIEETNIEKYGVKSPLQRPDVFEKAHSLESRKKIVETNLKKYGYMYGLQSPEVIQKIATTNQEKYGYSCVLSIPEIRKKSYEKLLENAKVQKSKAEDEVFEIVSQLFPDAVRHYMTDEFPFNVDIYVPSLDLYIEYQGSHFHNRRAFLGTKDDMNEVEEFKKRAIEKKSETGDEISQYDNIIYVWADLDVRKRNLAKSIGLNYLEIYSFKDSQDIINQLNMWINCYLGNRLINVSDDVLQTEFDNYKSMHIEDINSLDITSKHNNIVKQFQFCEFFKEEMNLYATDPIIRRKVIQNRIHYLNKKEYCLTPQDIIRGFKISGIHYGYSHFNPGYTNWFINKYNLKCIYDPCGGWGHHLLGMLSCEKIYYNDLNKHTCENIVTMCEYFNISDKVIVTNDDAVIHSVPDDADGMFMCPPYYNLEVYNEHTFSGLDEYKLFLDNVIKIWLDSNVKVLGIILREDYMKLINVVPTESYILNDAQSHFTKNKKINHEIFNIYKK